MVEKTKKHLTVTRRKSFLLAAEKKFSSLLEAHDHRQDPGENGRRIEHFIGENEHLYEIIGGRPVYCQKLINGGRRGKDTWRYSNTGDSFQRQWIY